MAMIYDADTERVREETEDPRAMLRPLEVADLLDLHINTVYRKLAHLQKRSDRFYRKALRLTPVTLSNENIYHSFEYKKGGMTMCKKTMFLP